MSREDSFPLSPTNARRIAVLFVIYGVLVIAGASYYYIVSGDRSFPLPYLFQVIVIGLCAWGINARRRWALLLAGVYATWQSYAGVSNIILFLNLGGSAAPTHAKVIVGLLALRTLLLIVLLVLLLYFTSRERLDKH